MKEAKWLDRTGVRIYYELLPAQDGLGKPSMMVYLHGHGGNLTVFNHQREYFYNSGLTGAIAIDRRGNGKSTLVTDSCAQSLETNTSDLEGILNAEKIEQGVIIVGHSAGAVIAQQYAAQHPDKTGALILISASSDPATSVGRNDLLKFVQAMAEPLDKAFWTAYNHLSVGVFGRSTNYYPNMAEDHFRNMNELMIAFLGANKNMPEQMKALYAERKAVMKWNVSDAASRITAPTLIIHGARDFLIPAKEAYTLQERIPGARGIAPVVIANAGHGVPFQAPEQANVAMERFLREIVYHT